MVISAGDLAVTVIGFGRYVASGYFVVSAGVSCWSLHALEYMRTCLRCGMAFLHNLS